MHGIDAKRINSKFGKQLRELRLGRQLTQVVLAERSSLSVDAVRRIERGAFSPSLETIRRLCVGLGVTMATVFQLLESGQRDDVAEISDYLASRSRDELHLAWRVLRVLFEEDPPPRRG